MSEQPGRYQRSFSGMVGALVILLLVIAAFVIFRDVNRNDPANPLTAVDYAPTARYARQEADFRVLAPRRLPDGWMATSAGFQQQPHDTWHLGMLTRDKRYVGLEQAAVSVDDLVDAHLDEAAEEGDPVTVGAARWRTFTDGDGDLALAREQAGTGTLVYGRVAQATLEELVGTLR